MIPSFVCIVTDDKVQAGAQPIFPYFYLQWNSEV